ncbi:glycosyltransferase family 9 protein [Billgrantia montanilacus]|uniref:Lipopolysaccharide heptosyltransferase family protein n=1 Tax=Billgrantia montanilacus TaxID=2282305 RepID=A0A368U0Q1_9GAMM|nr:glycosyltransferase family 9 protein [Halomonas montanilacus]RCV90635.1 lipopolysaccharide heptosyltransferase family protein [Halomonas montanilacus]
MTSSANGGNPRESTRILVVRNDKVGDFMLAWPALAYLKATSPALHISVLVPTYTAPLARLCPWIDEVILDPGGDAGRNAQRSLLQQLRAGRFAALLTLYSTPRIGWLGWRSGIPLRLAPATKWAQLFYNHRVTQRRSRSTRPEYVYNIELADALLLALGVASVARPDPPYWPLPAGTSEVQRSRLAQELGIATSRPWIYLHAGSGGSAVNLTPGQYAQLARLIDARAGGSRPIWIMTAGPSEEATAGELRDRLESDGLEAVVLPPRRGLGDFAMTLAAADLFIAGSTGPLHIAGCLDRPTAGFYPARRSATPLRWQTCNSESHRLAFSPPPGAAESDMAAIDLDVAATAISELIYRLEEATSEF